MQKNQRTPGKQKFVPVMLAGGIPAMVNPHDISDGQWDNNHGTTAAGKKVNSMRYKIIGDSVLLGKVGVATTLSVTQDEYEVSATQFLTTKGFTITPPNIGQ